jgi:hypothetical protein
MEACQCSFYEWSGVYNVLMNEQCKHVLMLYFDDVNVTDNSTRRKGPHLLQ